MFSAVLGGMLVTFISLFCGFMIKAQDFPDFWIFMYWLDPLHYVLEGLVVTQFNGDHTPVSVTGTAVTETANSFVSNFYSAWRYESRGYDILALCLFIVAFRYVLCFYDLLLMLISLTFNYFMCRLGTYLSLEYVRHDKR